MSHSASDVRVYAVGICSASACYPAGMAVDDITAAVNFNVRTGLDHGWAPSDDESFATGEPNPCPCNDDPARLHRLFNC